MITHNEYSAYLPIRTLSAKTGVNSVTIRAWERRYGLLKPVRTEKGHRLYNYGHVQRIKMILELIEKGIPVSQIKPLLEKENDTTIKSDGENIWLSLKEKFDFYVQDFNFSKANVLYNQVLSLYPIDLVAKHLFMPILKHYKSNSLEYSFFYFFLRNKLITKLQIESEWITGQKLLLITSMSQKNEIFLLIKALTASALGFLPICLFAPKEFSELDKIVGKKNIAAVVYMGEDDFLRQVKKIDSLPVFVFLQGKTVKTTKNVLARKGIKILTDNDKAAFEQIKSVLYY